MNPPTKTPSARALVVALLAGSMMLLAAPAASVAQEPSGQADDATNIEILSPSDFDADPTTPLIISDKKTTKNETFRLSAWVSEVPVNPVVEFELEVGIRSVNLGPATQVATDTFELQWDIPNSVVDGQYTLRAILAGGAVPEEVDRDEAFVTILHGAPDPTTAAETTDMVYPEGGGQAGFYTNPVSKRTNIVVDPVISGGTRHRTYYTLSQPGTEPVWKRCANGSASGAASDGQFCALVGRDQPTAVTGLGTEVRRTANANTDSPGANQSTDATRIFPYLQQPTRLTIDPPTLKVAPLEGGGFECQDLTARIVDQVARKIADVNLDYHAIGPTDQLFFDTFEDPSEIFTSGETAPDKNHSGEEAGTDCGLGDELPGEQGEHQIIGAPDRKHVETRFNTDDGGNNQFGLLAEVVGTSHVVAWADVNDNDLQEFDEVSAGARIGWGEEPAPPAKEVLIEPGSQSATPGSCQTFVALAREGGNPMANTNMDVHITSTDPSATFCDASGTSTRRAPDQGGHVGDAHPEESTTRHTEGETDVTGRFTFGVTAGTATTVQILAWVDSTDDDVFTEEPSESAQAEFEPGARDISVRRSRKSVRAGSRVRLSGEITSEVASCVAGQRVKLKARRVGARRFGTIASTRTGEDGRYSFRTRVKRSKEYRAIAPKTPACAKARSRKVTVRAR